MSGPESRPGRASMAFFLVVWTIFSLFLIFQASPPSPRRASSGMEASSSWAGLRWRSWRPLARSSISPWPLDLVQCFDLVPSPLRPLRRTLLLGHRQLSVKTSAALVVDFSWHQISSFFLAGEFYPGQYYGQDLHPWKLLNPSLPLGSQASC